MDSADIRIRRWDAIGVVVSAACILHCIAVPLLLGLLPALGLGFLAKDGFHQILAVVVLLVAAVAFVPGYRLHKKNGVLVFGLSGVVLLGGAAFYPDLPTGVEAIITSSGGALLVTAHILNRRAANHTHPH
jgi:hypothetical protein